MRKIVLAFAPLLAAGLLGFASCDKKPLDPVNPGEGEKESELTQDELSTRYYVNLFGYNVMSMYYLWCDEISDELEEWGSNDSYADPVAKVKDIRYKKKDGTDYDRWTQMIDDFKTFSSSVDGESKTYGYDCTLLYEDATRKNIVAVITYVSAGSPAEKAGIKRGDVVQLVNGKRMTEANYVDIVNNQMFAGDSVSLTMMDGTAFSLNSIEMYEDPVNLYKTFDVDGKKVGYLFYTSFTLKSCDRLIEACKYFKAQGIEDLILDLRYNGGGYVFAETVLASMLAPAADVAAGGVLETEVYNKLLAKEFPSESTKLSFSHQIESDGKILKYNTEDANIGIKHLYAILGSGSASASESILTCLMPYLPVKIIGEQSHGKFCTGIMYGAVDWYEDYKDYVSKNVYTRGRKYADNWGIYVMIGRYADKNGNTPCMPDGFTPDYPVNDMPHDGYQIGDEKETMLAKALDVVAGTVRGGATLRRKGQAGEIVRTGFQHERPEAGKRIIKLPACSGMTPDRGIPQGKL